VAAVAVDVDIDVDAEVAGDVVAVAAEVQVVVAGAEVCLPCHFGRSILRCALLAESL